MSHKTPKSLSELVFQAGGPLGELARAAAAAVTLGDHLQARLGPDLAPGIAGARLREDGAVVVLPTSPAWAARLRFEGERLLAEARSRHPGAVRVEVRVGGPGAPPA